MVDYKPELVALAARLNQGLAKLSATDIVQGTDDYVGVGEILCQNAINLKGEPEVVITFPIIAMLRKDNRVFVARNCQPQLGGEIMILDSREMTWRDDVFMQMMTYWLANRLGL